MIGSTNFSWMQPQANQYEDGNTYGADFNTDWMSPTGNGDSTLAGATETEKPKPEDTNVQRTNTDYENKNQVGLGTRPQLVDGTALGQVTGGWMMPSSQGIRPMPSIPDWYKGPIIQTSEGDIMGDPFARPPSSQNQSPNYGAAPMGFDQQKWADPNLGTSNKYIAGRMAAELLGQGMNPADITRQVAQRLGATAISDDAIRFGDGFTADLFFDVGGPNQRVQFTDVTQRPEDNQHANSMFDFGMGGADSANSLFDPEAVKQMVQRLFQQNQQGRQQILQDRNSSSIMSAPPRGTFLDAFKPGFVSPVDPNYDPSKPVY